MKKTSIPTDTKYSEEVDGRVGTVEANGPVSDDFVRQFHPWPFAYLLHPTGGHQRWKQPEADQLHDEAGGHQKKHAQYKPNNVQVNVREHWPLQLDRRLQPIICDLTQEVAANDYP